MRHTNTDSDGNPTNSYKYEYKHKYAGVAERDQYFDSAERNEHSNACAHDMRGGLERGF
jgi:hypothetical protein